MLKLLIITIIVVFIYLGYCYLPNNKSTSTQLAQTARIQELIKHLDQVSLRSPSSDNISDDPIADALIKEGDAAVEPLINVLETDARISRSVWVNQVRSDPPDFPVGVCQVTFEILSKILKTNTFTDDSNIAYSYDDIQNLTGHKALGEIIRQYWNKFKSYPEPIREYQVLMDDKALPGQWVSKAVCIADIAQLKYNGDSEKEDWKLLSALTNPSVSEIMSKRIDDSFYMVFPDIDAQIPSIFDWQQRDKLNDAFLITVNLINWDREKSMPFFKKFYTRLIKLHDHSVFDQYSPAIQSQIRSTIDQYIIQIMSQAFGTEDDFKHYAQWIERLSSEDVKEYSDINNTTDDMVVPFEQNQDPMVLNVAEKVFFGREFNWNRPQAIAAIKEFIRKKLSQ